MPRDDSSDKLHRLLSRTTALLSYLLVPYLIFYQKLLEKAWCYYHIKPSVNNQGTLLFFRTKIPSTRIFYFSFPFLLLVAGHGD